MSRVPQRLLTDGISSACFSTTVQPVFQASKSTSTHLSTLELDEEIAHRLLRRLGPRLLIVNTQLPRSDGAEGGVERRQRESVFSP